MAYERAGGSASEDSSTVLKVAGAAWSGEIVVQLDTWTVRELRTEIARRSGLHPDAISMICAGRRLTDDGPSGDATLRSKGVHGRSRVLIMRKEGAHKTEIDQEAERSARLSRLKAAADAIAQRTGNPFSGEGYEFDLEDQSGRKLVLSDGDRRALAMGLMFHAKGRGLVERKEYREATEVLSMAEEAFSLSNKEHWELVDNVPQVQIDLVWCLFMLKDIDRLADARQRLTQARAHLGRAHGANLERLRMLQGGFCPELALYVRLELLEGVVAFYAGDLESARRILSSAKDKFHQLQVSNEALVTLLSMGITSREARRSLRVSGQDPCRAAQFVFEQRQKMAEKVEEDRRLWRERREQKSYGKTPTGKAVDLAKLAEIESLGYPRALAAEALRQADNERAKALDILLNPDLLVALEVAICKKKGKKRSREHVDEVSLAILVSQGFSRSEAKSALRETEGDVEAALAGLVSKATDASSTAATGGPSGEGTCGSEAGGAGEASQTRDGEAVREEDFLSADEDDEGTMNEVRDVGMEDEIARDISGDPFSEYDVDMAEEGKAIEEYLALVESSCTSARGNLHAPSS